MAVPFFVPDDAEAAASQGSASQATSPTTTSPVLIPQSGTSSSSQSPLQSPVNGEHLVQAFCEALYRYSRGGWWRNFIC